MTINDAYNALAHQNAGIDAQAWRNVRNGTDGASRARAQQAAQATSLLTNPQRLNVAFQDMGMAPDAAAVAAAGTIRTIQEATLPTAAAPVDTIASKMAEAFRSGLGLTAAEAAIAARGR